MTTPVEIINLALKQVGVLGVGQTAAAEDIADAFAILNMMLAQWSVKKNLVHQIFDVACVSTGAATYTVGAGGDFNTARPPRVMGAYCRQLAPVPIDYDLELLMSQKDWGRVSTKTISSMPSLVYYDPQYPLGVLHVWPIATVGYELHLLMLAPLTQFATPYDDINLPAEYMEALMYNLAGRLYSMYGRPVDPVTIALATAALGTLRQANTQVGKLYMPAAVVGRANYNPYSDN
jgi:hypothetical protein